MAQTRLHEAPHGRERFAPGARIERHRHTTPYAAIVLSGSYEEAGSAGRRQPRPGWVVLHDAFDSHRNCFCRSGGEVFNLALDGQPIPFKWARIADADAVVRAAERDTVEAASLLLSKLEPAPEPAPDWPDLLCATLCETPNIALARWAQDHHLARETVSRQFRAIFGTTPAAFRAEARARNALRQIAAGRPLAQLAAQSGFADQAHMTRAIRALTGTTPRNWRRSLSFKTDGGVRA